MELMYSSTRNDKVKLTASQAILKGLADDGGLFVPERIPALDVPMDTLADMSYQETAYEVMSRFFTDFTEDELKDCIKKAYDSKFDTPEIAPLVDADGAYYLELFHGPTIAFKDMALSILPHLLITSARKNQVKNDIVILTATSGDTGKAALAGFADVEGTKIVVFYPKNGVSPIQEKQMITQKGANTCVVGIHGNFDQAQTGVKKMFNDTALEAELDVAGYQFSSANSINIGRLIPQVAYYVYAYAKLYKNGAIAKDEKINVVVPTGNFGNILAAFYAKNMGLPIAKLICASNENKVLYDFFSTGTYDRNRDFILTSSPSMDILISSNLERLIYRIAGNDAEKNTKMMEELSTDGKYAITDEMRAQLADFYGNYTSEEETAKTIKKLYEDTGYIIDTHTAVAAGVYDKYKKDTGDTETKTVIASTASPFKFTRSVMDAIDPKYDAMGDFELVDELSRIGNVKVPQAIERETEGVKINMPQPTDHLFFQFCHARKHLLASGVGIRQICDILLFAEHYEKEIDWKIFWDRIRMTDGILFAEAIFRLGVQYLGFEEKQFYFPEGVHSMKLDTERLMEDILHSGIHGKGTRSRLHSGTLTLHAAEKRGLSGIFPGLFYMAFPPAKNLLWRFPYLKKHPYLLPFAWGQRLCGYLREGPVLGSVKEIVKTGRKRKEILREYGIFGEKRR